MAFPLNYLRREILSSSTETLGIIPRDILLRKSEISDFYVAISVYKNVFRFQVSVDDIL